MNHIYFGSIYPSDTAVIRNKTEKLIFLGCEVKMLNQVLAETTAIKESQGNIKATFFLGSRFSQTLEFSSHSVTQLFSSKNELESDIKGNNHHFNCINKVVIATGVSELNELLIKNASWLVRGSETLEKADFIDLSNEFRAIDGRGAVFCEKLDNTDNAHRLVLLMMLALAYERALQQISEELAEVLKNPQAELKTLENLYKEAAIFNARYYFDNPVLFSRYPTFCAWKDIKNAYSISAKDTEVTAQISQVHQILDHIQDKEDQKQNEALNNKMAIFGVILSALGLIEVADVLFSWFK